MKLEKTFLASRVAVRIFILFGLCALLPITALAFIAFSQVTSHLQAQTQERLHQSTKTLGMAVLERLLALESLLKVIASDVRTGTYFSSKNLAQEHGDSLPMRQFMWVGLLTEGGKITTLQGPIPVHPTFAPTEKQHLNSGKTLLWTQTHPDQPARLFMARIVDPKDLHHRILIGEINRSTFWEVVDKDNLAPGREVCILDHAFSMIACSVPGGPVSPIQAALNQADSTTGQFQWEHGGEEYLASFWSIPIKFTFFAPQWTIVVSESRSNALAPLASFQADFTGITLLSLLVVVLLSLVQIRRSLVPLEQLRAGTQRIAMRDFTNPIQVASRDEFEELAASFNAMAGRLGKQFQTLATMVDIDRAILSVLDIRKIVNTVLTRMRDLFPCDCVSMTLRESKETEGATVYLWDGTAGRGIQVQPGQLTTREMRTLWDSADRMTALDEGATPALAPLARLGIKSCLVLPISLTQGLVGIIVLGFRDQPALTQEDTAQARQLADQVAVALSNAYETAERKRAEESLQESNRQLKAALDELAATQRQIVQQERLRALGQMSSGVAHDFNNALSPILGFSSILLEEPELLNDKEKVTKYLQTINTAGQDAANVVSRLRGFYRSREKQEALKPFNLNQLVEQSISLTQPRWKDQALANGTTIKVETDLQKIPVLAGNESEVREVLTNLIFNAVDAMPDGGTITLRTRANDSQAFLEVSDTGTGMTEETRQRCLEPFFTTKGDRGTGLGLAMVYGIIRRHQGTINIQSEPGKGTTFVIGLPLGGKEEKDEPQPAEARALSRRLRILVMDDDPLALKATVECLLTDNHTVETATNGRQGLLKFHTGRYDLVLTDHGMPEMNGERVAAAIKRVAPTVPVILLTGYGQTMLTPGESLGDVDLTVRKPLTRSGLRQAIAKVIA